MRTCWKTAWSGPGARRDFPTMPLRCSGGTWLPGFQARMFDRSPQSAKAAEPEALRYAGTWGPVTDSTPDRSGIHRLAGSSSRRVFQHTRPSAGSTMGELSAREVLLNAALNRDRAGNCVCTRGAGSGFRHLQLAMLAVDHDRYAVRIESNRMVAVEICRPLAIWLHPEKTLAGRVGSQIVRLRT